MPMYFPMPRFIIPMNLSQTAKIIYGLLLGRTTLSQRNNFADGDGNIYVIYPVRSLADDLGKTIMTVKNAIRELVNVGLLEKRKASSGRVNFLYVKLPIREEEERILLGEWDERITENDAGKTEKGKENYPCKEEKGKENFTYIGKKTLPIRDRKLSPSNINKKYKRVNKYVYREGESF